MATKSTSSTFLGGDQSPERIRQEFIEKPFGAARQTLLSTGFELFEVIKLLPDTFIMSQQRELERLKATAPEDDVRVSALKASITQATELRTTIKRGEARVKRAVGALADSDVAFHGFVSNAELQPISGLTIRLAGTQAARKNLSATTDADGYFRIALGSKPQEARESKELDFEDRIGILFRSFSERSTESERAAASSGANARVEILRDKEVVFTDEVPLTVDEDGAYREYVVAVKESMGPEASVEFDYKGAAGRKIRDIEKTKKAPKKKGRKPRATKRPK
jgi:hypothetical protein